MFVKVFEDKIVNLFQSMLQSMVEAIVWYFLTLDRDPVKVLTILVGFAFGLWIASRIFRFGRRWVQGLFLKHPEHQELYAALQKDRELSTQLLEAENLLRVKARRSPMVWVGVSHMLLAQRGKLPQPEVAKAILDSEYMRLEEYEDDVAVHLQHARLSLQLFLTLPTEVQASKLEDAQFLYPRQELEKSRAYLQKKILAKKLELPLSLISLEMTFTGAAQGAWEASLFTLGLAGISFLLSIGFAVQG